MALDSHCIFSLLYQESSRKNGIKRLLQTLSFLALSFSPEGLGEVGQTSGLPRTGHGGQHRWRVHRGLVLALGPGICRVSRLRGEAGEGASGWEGLKTVVGPKDPRVALGAGPKKG